MQIPDSVSIGALWNDYVRNSYVRLFTRYGFRQILHADQKCDGFYVWCFGNHKPEVYIRFYRCADSDFAVLSSGQHIFKRIGTKFLKLSNADFVLSGKWDRKYKSDSSDVQIPLSVSISALWNDYAQNSLPIFTNILHAAQKCGRFDAYCLWDKQEVVFRF